jgi:hypothetical protein
LTITNVTGTSFLQLGLTNGGTYYYTVSAVNDVGESGNSSPASATVPAFLLVTAAITGGSFTFQFQGVSGESYALETSTNLADWTTIFTNLLTNTLFIFTDTNALNPAQFYRINQ